MAEIDVTVDIDIEDYLDEVKDKYLIAEIENRGYKVTGGKTKVAGSTKELIKHIKELLNLQPYHTKERVMQEIKDLFDYSY
jgi:hypothetical protein